ncbi:fas-activated serine/threonine kinase, partial [Silurus asotus]
MAEVELHQRVIMSVNDKWHYCHNSDVLVGSRAMRDRHLQLLGYVILQLPYLELEKLNGIEEVKQYLHKKLLE